MAPFSKTLPSLERRQERAVQLMVFDLLGLLFNLKIAFFL